MAGAGVVVCVRVTEAEGVWTWVREPALGCCCCWPWARGLPDMVEQLLVMRGI